MKRSTPPNHTRKSPAALQRPGHDTEGVIFDARTTLLTFREWREVFNMMKDQSYQQTRLGPDLVEYLRWKKFDGGSESTLDQYERDISLICLAVPASVEEVTHADLMLVLDLRPEGSWRRIRAAWSSFFKWAIREGKRPDNPVERLPRMRRTQTPVYDIWTPDQLNLLVAGTRQADMPLTEKLRVLTMIETGARKGELRNLTLGDYDLYRRQVRLVGKTGPRLNTISPELVATVDEYMLTEYPVLGRLPLPSDHVWFGARKLRGRLVKLTPETIYSQRGFHDWWVRMEKAAGVDHKKPHMTRHTVGTDVFDATGGNLIAVRDVMGHSSTRVSEVYVHSSRTTSRSAAEAMFEYRRGGE